MNEYAPAVPYYLSIKTRPVGVAILSVLMLVSGLGMAGMLAYGAFFMSWQGRDVQLQRASEAVGAPVSVMIGSLVFLAALAIEAGFGMWKGRKWGWWLGSFWFVYAILRNANALVTMQVMTAGMSPLELALEVPGGMTRYQIKFGGRIVVSALLYLYFFKDNVREYFGLREASRWKAVVVQIGICVAMVIGTSVLAATMQAPESVVEEAPADPSMRYR